MLNYGYDFLGAGQESRGCHSHRYVRPLFGHGLVGTIQYNLGVSLNSIEEAELNYATFGSANELLSDLNRGDLEIDTYTEGRPYRVQENNVEILTWIETLEENEEVIFAVALASRPGQSRRHRSIYLRLPER